MKRTNAGSALAIAMLLGIASTANAATIYNNGGPIVQTGLPIKGFATADDFTLAANAAIQSVGFYLQTDTGIAGWSQSVNYAFMSNAGGVPGAVLASGAAQNVTETDSGLSWCCVLAPTEWRNGHQPQCLLDYHVWWGRDQSIVLLGSELIGRFSSRVQFERHNPGHAGTGAYRHGAGWTRVCVAGAGTAESYAPGLTGPAASISIDSRGEP